MLVCLGVSIRSKFALLHRLSWSPLTQCSRYRAACDILRGRIKGETGKPRFTWTWKDGCMCLFAVLQVMHNDVYINAQIRHSVIRRNLGNGVSTRGSFFQLYDCTLADNTAAGFEYNPSYTTYEALQVH